MRFPIRAGLLLLAALFVTSAPPVSSAPPVIRITSIPDGAVVPANWPFPLVAWTDTEPLAKEYAVVFDNGEKSFTAPAEGRVFRPTREQLLPLLRPGSLSIIVRRPHTPRGIVVSSSVRVTVAPEPFTDTLVYRLVEPLFNPGQDAVLNVFRADADRPDMNRLADSLCLGCHVYRGSEAAFNVRRDKDRRLVTNFGAPDGRDWRDRLGGEFSFLGFSPDGKTMALVVNTRSLIMIKKNFSEPFDMTYVSGDLALLKPGDAAPALVPGASDPAVVEDMPAFSPDGRTLVFCRYAPSPEAPRLKPVSIYTIPSAGGEAKPLLDQSPSAYCYFPRYSPDGKWISFAAGDASHSYFARRSADIWLYRPADRTLRNLESNAADAMDSWHAWSSDGRWLVFSSNRNTDGLTALFLTRIADDGHASPPLQITADAPWKANLPFLVPGRGPITADSDPGAFLRQIYPSPQR